MMLEMKANFLAAIFESIRQSLRSRPFEVNILPQEQSQFCNYYVHLLPYCSIYAALDCL